MASGRCPTQRPDGHKNFDIFKWLYLAYYLVYFTVHSLKTGTYGAFSTSTSNFPGQIQSTIIDTSYKSILTC